ncbi:MAG: hypothetical protein ACRDI2_21645 [Chloroflexota bacterium]
MTSAQFLAHIGELIEARCVREALAYYDRHGPELMPRLTSQERVQVNDMMEYAETAAELALEEETRSTRAPAATSA